jgi:16S rRNA (uracil1498-N3)-methyltransferase
MTNRVTEAGGKTRLYVAAALAAGARIVPDTGQTHYLLHVLRVQAGMRVGLFNGRDGEWLAVIAQVTKRGCVLECEKQAAPQAEVPDIWLAFAPIKKTPGDYVAQKATELGAVALLPVFTRRTIVTRINTERLRANAIEAAEQSGRLSVPEIHAPQTLERLIADWPRERHLIFCDEGGDARPIADALPDAPCAILTGPEGGFDSSEREMLRAQPFVRPVSLGARILRADTAALAALAVWQALKGDGR